MRIKSKKFIDTALSILCAHHFKHLPIINILWCETIHPTRTHLFQKESDDQFQQSLIIQYL